jgi:MFS family permease
VGKAIALLFLEGSGVALYFLAFTFHLLERGFSYALVSWTIACTALVGVFLGPVIGFYVDQSRSKRRLLVASFLAMCSGIAVQLASAHLVGASEVVAVLVGVALFALSYNPATLLVTQYLQPTLRSDIEAAYSVAARIQSYAVVASALTAFLLFDLLRPTGLIAVAACLILASACVSLLTTSLDEDKGVTANTREGGRISSARFVLGVLRRVPFLVVSVVVVALTVDAVGTNLESIAVYFDAFPIRFVLLGAAFEGFLSMAAASYYSARFAGAASGLALPHLLSLALFFVSFALLLAVYYVGDGYGALLFFMLSYITASVGNCWWGIVSIVWIRSSTENGNYARTMAAIKMPRALVTFIGVGSVGIFLDRSGLDALLLGCAAAMACLLVLTYTRSADGRGPKQNASDL